MINKDMIPYLKTFFITLLFIAVVVVFTLILKVENYRFQSKKYLTVKNENKIALINKSYDYLIDKYKYLSVQEPNNYKHNMSQGFLYELSGDYDKAISQYLLAIKKSNSLELEPFFKLVNIYLNKREFEKANEIISKVEYEPYEDLNYFLAGYYQNYGDILINDGSPVSALVKYRAAFDIYAKNRIGKPPKKLLDSISQIYEQLADKAVDNRDFKKAVDFLHYSILYSNNDTAYYKLAIIYLELDKNKSLKYFDMTFKRKPEIINYELYNLLINDLIEEGVAKNDFALVKNYRDKLNLIKRFEKYNLISENDFSVKIDYNSLKYDLKKQNKSIKLNLHIKNNSEIPVKTLYLTFKVRVNGTIVSVYKLKLVPKKQQSNLNLENIKANVPIGESFLLNSTRPAKMEIYVSKNAKIDPKLIQDFDIMLK